MSIFYKKSIPFEKIKLIRKVADSKRIQADVVAIFVVTDQSKEVLRVAKANNVKIINIKDFDKRTLP